MKRMKKILIATLTVTLLIVHYNVNAQQGLSLSVKATPQFSFLQNEDDNDNGSIDNKATFNTNFGIGVGYNFTPKLGVGLDVLYSLQGQRRESGGVETNEKVNYLKIPVFFTYTADASKPVSFIAKAGPQLSVLTTAKLADNDGDDIISDTKDRYQSATFGAVAGAGVQFRLQKNLFLTTSARFDYDFTNAEDDSHASYNTGRAKTYNMTTGLEVGLKYFIR